MRYARHSYMIRRFVVGRFRLNSNKIFAFDGYLMNGLAWLRELISAKRKRWRDCYARVWSWNGRISWKLTLRYTRLNLRSIFEWPLKTACCGTDIVLKSTGQPEMCTRGRVLNKHCAIALIFTKIPLQNNTGQTQKRIWKLCANRIHSLIFLEI